MRYLTEINVTPVLWQQPFEYTSLPDCYARWVGHFVPGDNNTPTANLHRYFVRDGIYNDVIISVTTAKTQSRNPAHCDHSIQVHFFTAMPQYMTIDQLDEMYQAIHECKRKIYHHVNNNIIPKFNEFDIR